MTGLRALRRIEIRLNQPQRVWALWFGTPCIIVAWLGLALALIAPPHGTEIQLCWQQSVTHLPCPGCGLTRSLSCGLRGMFAASWHYHPLGLPILGLFMLTAAQSLLPAHFRERLKQHVQARAVAFNSLYLAFVIAFVAYGIGRAFIQGVIQWWR